MSEIYEMNIDEIEKYIIGKKIKDMSLEEIRNFIETQGNTIILNHHIYEKQQLEIERLNKGLDELEELCKTKYYEKNTTDIDSIAIAGDLYVYMYKKIKELKGSDKE